jgi:hypothetical protein
VAYRELDSRSEDGSTNFLAIPTEWLEDFGRIAILSGRIELAAYEVGRILELPRPSNGRTRPFRQECTDIARRLNDPWLPAGLADGLGAAWREQVLEWVAAAPAAMDAHRNALLHRPYVYLKHEGKWGPGYLPDSRRFTDGVPLTAAMLESAVRELIPVDRAGSRLWLGDTKDAQDPTDE